jgi:hypothetical protein
MYICSSRLGLIKMVAFTLLAYAFNMMHHIKSKHKNVRKGCT